MGMMGWGGGIELPNSLYDRGYLIYKYPFSSPVRQCCKLSASPPSQLTQVNRLIPVTWLIMNSKLFYLLSLIWSAGKTYEVIWPGLNGAYNRSLAKA